MFNKLTLESFEAFLTKLSHFDYYYSFSDDINVYRRGKAEDNEIKKICENPEFNSVYEVWETWYTNKEKTKECLELDLIRGRLKKEEMT